MRNGEAASAAPAPAAASRRRREIDPDVVMRLVMVSSREPYILGYL
jgi:hypothetical protein